MEKYEYYDLHTHFLPGMDLGCKNTNEEKTLKITVPENLDYETVFERFGFTKDDEGRPLSEFSGGQRTKIAFIKLLLSRPDILILDEVLSVGDGAFRQKSEKKMLEIIKGGGNIHCITQQIPC